jgi:hypothetical protein
MRFFLLMLCLTACSLGSEPQRYGAPSPDLERMAIDLDKGLKAPLADVVVRGEIGQVCDQGCWFYLLGAKGLVYVKLDLGRGLVIPVDSKGKKAVVGGRLEGEGEQRTLVADSVVIY